MLDASFCHFTGFGSILSHSNFWWKILLANNVDTDQMPHYGVSNLGLHCVKSLWLFYGFPVKNGSRGKNLLFPLRVDLINGALPGGRQTKTNAISHGNMAEKYPMEIWQKNMEMYPLTLTVLLSKQPKFHRIFAVLSAIGLSFTNNTSMSFHHFYKEKILWLPVASIDEQAHPMGSTLTGDSASKGANSSFKNCSYWEGR